MLKSTIFPHEVNFSLNELLKTKVGQTERARRELGLVGALPDQERKPKPSVQSLGSKAPRPKRGKGKVAIVVTIIRCGAKELDDDNLRTGAKPLRDSIATSLGVDDADPRVRWEYGQIIGTNGSAGTIVKVESIK